MGFFRELFRLTRFEHALMLAAAVLTGETVLLGALPPLTIPIGLSLLVPMLSEMGSFALNDYLDIRTDRLNRKKDRPLVKGTITPGFALWFSLACLALSVILSYFINSAAFAIALAFNLLAVAYNRKLKDLPLVGNAYIGLTMAIPFIFGNYVVSGELSMLALSLACMGFVAGLAREIVKSAQDMEGDVKARGSRTLPVIIGKRASLAVASLLYISFIPLSLSPFSLGLRLSLPAASLIGVADATILLIVFRLLSPAGDPYGFARNASLVAFATGMAGILVAAI
jgi:geranylgeranylglycerol-phosphate geranylgeranyltransferase